MTFSLERSDATLVNLNPRPEVHGDEHKPACDIRLSVELSNDALAMFHQTLKHSFYDRDDGDMLDAANEQHRPKLRFPQLAPLAWDLEMVGASLSVHRGVSGASDILIGEAAINKFRLTLANGGTVKIDFRVQCHPTAAQMADLYELMGEAVLISVTPPGAEAEQTKPAPQHELPGSQELRDELDSWPFPTSHRAAFDLLREVGYELTEEEVKRWTGPQVIEAKAYAEALSKVKEGKTPGKVPPILRGRVRNGRPTQVH